MRAVPPGSFQNDAEQWAMRGGNGRAVAEGGGRACVRYHLRERERTSMPSTQIRPDVGSYSRCRSCSNVDLPQLVVPTSAVTWQAGTCSVKLLSTCDVGRDGNAKDTS